MEIAQDLVLRSINSLRVAATVAEETARRAPSRDGYRNALGMAEDWRALAGELEAALPTFVGEANPWDVT